MRKVGMWRLFSVVALAIGAVAPVAAQEPEATTREAAIEQAQAEKGKTLHAYIPGKAEALLDRAEDILTNGVPSWHPVSQQRLFRRRLHARRRLRAPREPVQHVRCARQLHDQGLQTR